MHKGINSTLDEGQPPIIAFPARMSATQCASSEDVSCSLGALNPTAVAFTQNQAADVLVMRSLGTNQNETGRNAPNVMATMQVRRLTPKECERLQGFQDDYTLVPYRGKPAMDGPRYKALGNSMAVNCMRWIGERIHLVEGML